MSDKAIVEHAIVEVEIFCDAAATAIRSHIPIGFGAEYKQLDVELQRMLEEIPRRFKRAIRKAQKQHGWASR